MPLVRPSEDKRTRATARECGAHLPVQGPRLPQLAMTAAVEPDLGEDQRPIAREVVESREVGLEALLGLEVDIEAGQVDKPELEILRRRIVHVRDKAARVFAPGRPGEAFEEALRPPSSISTITPA